jgi:uncharacterized protein (DUF433 family)
MKGRPSEAGLVYFMRRADGVGPIKIGCSKHTARRVQSCQVWSPEPLEIVASVAGTFADEWRLHSEFKDYRLHGEWFEAAPPLLALVARVVATGTLPPPRADDRNVRIMALYEGGETYEKIASEFGITRQRVEQIVRKNGGTPRGHIGYKRAPVWGAQDKVRSLAASGCTKAEIADAIGDTYQNVVNATSFWGIVTRRATKGHSPEITAEAFEIAADYKAGHSTLEIAERHGRKQPEIYRLLRLAGVQPNRLGRVANVLNVEAVLADYRAGATIAEVAARHSRSKNSIRRYLAKAKALRSRAESEAIRVQRVREANMRRHGTRAEAA